MARFNINDTGILPSSPREVNDLMRSLLHRSVLPCWRTCFWTGIWVTVAAKQFERRLKRLAGKIANSRSACSPVMSLLEVMPALIEYSIGKSGPVPLVVAQVPEAIIFTTKPALAVKKVQ